LQWKLMSSINQGKLQAWQLDSLSHTHIVPLLILCLCLGMRVLCVCERETERNTTGLPWMEMETFVFHTLGQVAPVLTFYLSHTHIVSLLFLCLYLNKRICMCVCVCLCVCDEMKPNPHACPALRSSCLPYSTAREQAPNNSLSLTHTILSPLSLLVR
jgi:hypothetical protein